MYAKIYQKKAHRRAETIYLVSFFVVRSQLCDLCSDTCCFFMADIINITAPLFLPEYIVLNASVLLCLLGVYLPTSWTGSLSSQTINNCRLTGMILCHLQKV